MPTVPIIIPVHTKTECIIQDNKRYCESQPTLTTKQDLLHGLVV